MGGGINVLRSTSRSITCLDPMSIPEANTNCNVYGQYSINMTFVSTLTPRKFSTNFKMCKGVSSYIYRQKLCMHIVWSWLVKFQDWKKNIKSHLVLIEAKKYKSQKQWKK